jgi:hypothetical protein
VNCDWPKSLSEREGDLHRQVRRERWAKATSASHLRSVRDPFYAHSRKTPKKTTNFRTSPSSHEHPSSSNYFLRSICSFYLLGLKAFWLGSDSYFSITSFHAPRRPSSSRTGLDFLTVWGHNNLANRDLTVDYVIWVNSSSYNTG